MGCRRPEPKCPILGWSGIARTSDSVPVAYQDEWRPEVRPRPERSGPNGLARRASEANATSESGGEAEIAGGVRVKVRGRDAKFTRRRRAAHSGDAA